MLTSRVDYAKPASRLLVCVGARFSLVSHLTKQRLYPVSLCINTSAYRVTILQTCSLVLRILLNYVHKYIAIN